MRWVAAALALVLLVALGASAVAYNRLDANITTEDVISKLGSHRPTAMPVTGPSGPLNILLLGSDSRNGSKGKYGHETGARSDTTILLHLAADRRSATAMSIPRDSWVQLPSCVMDDGSKTSARFDRFNAAFSQGGTACTIKTVESLTHIRIDDYVVIDFEGFKSMVDALGGVPVCLPHAVDDPQSNIHLPAGRQVVKGEQALAFVRVRHGITYGSDLGRISRQQEFLAGLIQKVQSMGLLLNPVRLYAFLDAATKSVTTDPGLGSLNKLRGLTQQVQGIGQKQIRFVTVPVHDRPDHATVAFTQPKADQLFRALRSDGAGRGSGEASGSAKSPSPSAIPTAGLQGRTAAKDVCAS